MFDLRSSPMVDGVAQVAPPVVFGIVTASAGTSPGPASGISYTVYINSPTAPRSIDGVKPVGFRWPDELNTVAHPVGTPVMVGYTGEYMVFSFPTEGFQTVECEVPE